MLSILLREAKIAPHRPESIALILIDVYILHSSWSYLGERLSRTGERPITVDKKRNTHNFDCRLKEKVALPRFWWSKLTNDLPHRFI